MTSVYEVPAIGASIVYVLFALGVAADALWQSNYLGGAVAATSAVATARIAVVESELLSFRLVRLERGRAP